MKAVDVSPIENVVDDSPVGVVDDRTAPRRADAIFKSAQSSKRGSGGTLRAIGNNSPIFTICLL
jgi:hypothetical protein